MRWSGESWLGIIGQSQLQPRHDPRHRPDYGLGNCRHGAQSFCLQERSSIGGMAGAGPTAKFERRQGPIERHHEDRQHYIRRLLVIGATSVIRFARSKAPGTAEWLKKLLDRKSARLASVALANKMARIAWSVLTRGEVYRDIHPVPKPT
jgi:hypothetical protein